MQKLNGGKCGVWDRDRVATRYFPSKSTSARMRYQTKPKSGYHSLFFLLHHDTRLPPEKEWWLDADLRSNKYPQNQIRKANYISKGMCL